MMCDCLKKKLKRKMKLTETQQNILSADFNLAKPGLLRYSTLFFRIINNYWTRLSKIL
mgnify:CR=1 FL=1